MIIDIGAIWDVSTTNLMLLCELDPVTALGIVYITYLDHYYHWFERAALLDLLRYGAVGCVVYRMFWPWIHRTVVPNEFGGLHSRIGELYGCHNHASLQSPPRTCCISALACRRLRLQPPRLLPAIVLAALVVLTSPALEADVYSLCYQTSSVRA